MKSAGPVHVVIPRQALNCSYLKNFPLEIIVFGGDFDLIFDDDEGTMTGIRIRQTFLWADRLPPFVAHAHEKLPRAIA